jgi:hypothetical protein
MKFAESKDSYKRFEITEGFTAAIYGSMGPVKVPDLMSEKYGQMFSLFSSFNSMFVLDDKLCRISIISVPTTQDLSYLRTCVKAVCVLCHTGMEGWERYMEDTWTYVRENELRNVTVLVTSDIDLGMLTAESSPLREMQEMGVKVFLLSELSEEFINDFIYELLLLSKKPVPEYVPPQRKTLEQVEPEKPPVKGRKCLLM